MKKIIYITILSSMFFSCSKDEEKADGYGSFEATEITVSAQANGELYSFNLEEGQQIDKDAQVGYVDTVSLQLKKEMLYSQQDVIKAQSKGVLSQIAVLQEQIKVIEVNKDRVEKLLVDGAATQKQLDDINGEILVRQSQIKSVESQNAPVVSQLKSINAQLDEVQELIEKSKVINPVSGTVLQKYVESDEVVNFGKPLYKIADLATIYLKAYISETQLAKVKLGQQVTVHIDEGDGLKEYPGEISWISSNAEFTPKIIQTKEERVNLVYAVKVRVENDGGIKIGMPGEFDIAVYKE